jgi:hypothetical protein
MTTPPQVPPAGEEGGIAALLGNIGDPALRERVAAAVANGASGPAAPHTRRKERRSRPEHASVARVEPADARPSLITRYGTYRFAWRLDLERGRVRYELQRVGVFQLGPDEHHQDGYVRLCYGDSEGATWETEHGNAARPGAPTVYGVTLCGDAVFSPETATPQSAGWLVVRRPAVGSGGYRYSAPAPAKTSQKTAGIVAALVAHYTALPPETLERIRQAQQVHLAPGRLADLERRRALLRARIAEQARELYHLEQTARTQWALLPNDHPRRLDEPQ